MKTVLIFLLTLLFAATVNAASLEQRLQPILSGKVNMAADTFIMGTYDTYIATTARDILPEMLSDFGAGMIEMVNRYGAENLFLVEKQAFDRSAKRFAVLNRALVLRTAMQSPIATEPVLQTGMQAIAPGSVDEQVWNQIAGPSGLARRILGEYPKPVVLDEKYKFPLDSTQYLIAVRNQIGGIFIDKTSIKKTDEGCTALVVEGLNFDSEYGIGAMVTQATSRPHVDANYTVSLQEYSFARKACRQILFTVFDRSGNVIYSIRQPEAEAWNVDGEGHQHTLPFELMALRRNLPADVEKALAADLKDFDAYVQERLAEARELQGETDEDHEGHDH